MLAAYVVLWLGYRMQWAWLHALDIEAPRALRGYGLGHPGWVRSWDILCAVLGPNGFRILGAVIIVFAMLQRNPRVIVFLLASIGLSGVVTEAAKRLADRPRPSSGLVYAMSSAFPSGHAVAVMTGVLALLTVTAGLLGGALRVAALVTGAVVVIAIGFGRVALAVHYPSDVVAGWALGYLWFLGCLVVVRPRPLGSGRNTGSAR